MARFARTIVRLAVILVLSSGLVSGVLVGIGYSVNQLAHKVAVAKVVRLPSLASAAQLPSVIYAADGSVLATLRSSQYRQPVPLSRVSHILVAAVLDTEDHGFYVHGGFDVESIARALLADVNAGSAVQGGSTIAQQLVKNIYLTDQKTVNRKVREAVLAERLENKYSKDQILDAYLNTIYLGSGAYGVEAAAKEYFNRDADQLDVAQASLLAGLIQAPSLYDPLVNPLAARERRSEVLARMLHYGTITHAQATQADETPLPTVLYDKVVSYTTRGWYVQAVVKQLLANPALGATPDQREHELFAGGLKIYTNEDPALQAVAQQAAVEGIPSSLPGVVAAFDVENPLTGNVEALVGGPDAQGAQFDDATDGSAQPGSGFKLFALLAALEDGYNVQDTILPEGPCAIAFPENDGYVKTPMNNDSDEFVFPITLVQATAYSVNCAYLRLAHEVTLPKIVAMARSLGVSDPLSTIDPSIVLGSFVVHPIEMTGAYAAVADGGIYHRPTLVNHILDPSGDVIYNGETKGKRVFPQAIADEALEALRAVVEYGTGTAANLPTADVAGKTGTTEQSKAAWFNGITATFAASVWVGDPVKPYPMYVEGDEVFGAQYPAAIWTTVARYALDRTPYETWPTPDPYLLPPLKYINSPGLEHDDVYSHGWPPPTTVPPPPSTTTPTGTTPPGKTAPKQPVTGTTIPLGRISR